MVKRNEWSGYLIAVLLFLGLTDFNKEVRIEIPHKLTTIEIVQVIENDDSKPTSTQAELVRTIKRELKLEVVNNHRLSKFQIKHIIQGIDDIVFIFTNSKNILNLTYDGTSNRAIGVQFWALIDNIDVNIIFMDEDIICETSAVRDKLTIKHEMRHAIDHLLCEDGGYYSDDKHIISILDNDIIQLNALGTYKLIEKIHVYVESSTCFINKSDMEIEEWSDEQKSEFFKEKTKTRNTCVMIGIDTSRNISYYTSPGEVYVRFKSLKEYLYNRGYIKNINAEITKESIMYMLNDKDLLEKSRKNEIDFFNLIFFFKLDFTTHEVSNSERETLARMNSIL